MGQSTLPNIKELKTSQVAQSALLICGILSSVLWIAADIIASTLLEGYSYFHQTPSELSVIGTPTKTLLVQTDLAYSILLTAFGFGVWLSAHRKHSLRISAGLLIA